ncbi:DNA adenine methylase [Limnoglobus roseus]|uniref:DNA adenine methylase n=1 Tax=Limnoglobus roseus TaxID=2598579 RepID=A0A5C1ADS3_9BACT|nr:DNA adenine methylase [Limnoglobus roseus]QEL16860.1 DNA adenine methylase [Limnoglobus roseus]
MPTARPRLSPPLKSHDGKSDLAAALVDMMPPHIHFVVPYAGGLDVLLAKDPEGVSEVVNDVGRELTTFWRVLADPARFDRFARFARAAPVGEAGWRDAAAAGDDPVAAAAAFFVRCRQSLAGRTGDFAPRSRARTRRGMNERVSALLSAVDGLPAVYARLRRVVILDRDALAVIRGQDAAGTLFYLTPPPPAETPGAAAAAWDEMPADRHRELLAAVRACAGKVLLSGHSSALYDAALADWNRREFRLPNQAAGGKTKRPTTAVAWSNF